MHPLIHPWEGSCRLMMIPLGKAEKSFSQIVHTFFFFLSTLHRGVSHLRSTTSIHLIKISWEKDERICFFLLLAFRKVCGLREKVWEMYKIGPPTSVQFPSARMWTLKGKIERKKSPRLEKSRVLRRFDSFIKKLAKKFVEKNSWKIFQRFSVAPSEYNTGWKLFVPFSSTHGWLTAHWLLGLRWWAQVVGKKAKTSARKCIQIPTVCGFLTRWFSVAKLANWFENDNVEINC